jgi:hypothetical protein
VAHQLGTLRRRSWGYETPRPLDYLKAISDCTQAIIISSDERNRQGPYSGFYKLRADAYEKIGRKDLADADRKMADIVHQQSMGNR